MLTAVGIAAGMDVIDLCSGDGWFTLQIAKLARHVVAVDIDRSLLDIARLRLAESGINELRIGSRRRLRHRQARLAAGRCGIHRECISRRAGADTSGSCGSGCASSPAADLSIVNWHARPRRDDHIGRAARARDRASADA